MAETETKPVTMVPTHEQETGNLLACLKSYYRSSKFTDITVITPEKELRVHKLVLCSQSGYFARMFNGDWLEANTNTIKLEGDDHRFLVTMIDFMYGYDYDTTDHGNTSPIMFHIAAYQIADKYDVPKMKKRAKEKFEGIVAVGWDMDDFAAAVAEVYRTTPMCERGLRDPLVRVTNRRFGDLLQKESFVKMLEQTPGFAADLARTNYVGGCCNCKAGINADGCFESNTPGNQGYTGWEQAHLDAFTDAESDIDGQNWHQEGVWTW